MTTADLIARAYRPRFGLGTFAGLVPKHQVELGWVLVGQFFATVGSVVGVRMFTTYLRPQVYGDVALAMTGATFLQLLVMGPIGQGSLRFLAVADEQKEIAAYVRAVANLCGYAVDATSNENREQILINMRPSQKSQDKVWSGRIFDPTSGSTYDSTIALKVADSLKVQGCAFGGMFCGGQTWTRVN